MQYIRKKASKFLWKAWSQKNEGWFSIRLMFMVLGLTLEQLIRSAGKQMCSRPTTNWKRSCSTDLLPNQCSSQTLCLSFSGRFQWKLKLHKDMFYMTCYMWTDWCNHTAYTWLYSATWNLALRVYNPSRWMEYNIFLYLFDPSKNLMDHNYEHTNIVFKSSTI